MRLCYGPSKRLNFVQFMVFAQNSTNLDYWKIDTSDSCPLPPYFYIWWTSVLLSLRKVLLPRLFSGSETFLWQWQKQYVNYFEFTTLLEYKYKFSATQNYWIILMFLEKQKFTNTMNANWIQQITHTRHFKERWLKYNTAYKFVLFL